MFIEHWVLFSPTGVGGMISADYIGFLILQTIIIISTFEIPWLVDLSYEAKASSQLA